VRRGEIETANRVGVDEGEGREETGAQRKEATIGGDSVGRVRTRGKERKSGRTRGLCGRDSIKRTHINESFQSKTELYAGASISTRVRHACTYTWTGIQIHSRERTVECCYMLTNIWECSSADPYSKRFVWITRHSVAHSRGRNSRKAE